MKRIFGAHVSTSDGLRYAAIAARGLGVEALQLMLGESQSWSPYKINEDSINEFRKLSYGMAVYVHLPYTINPCIPRVGQIYGLQKSTMRKYLESAQAIGARAVVLHPGYKKELSEVSARKNLIAFITDVMTKAPNVRVLLEVDAGSKNGSKVGSPEFIAEVLQSPIREFCGMCIDTEHLFARGVDLWDDEVRKGFLKDFGNLTEFVHLNVPDPGVELGSYLDRHQTALESYPRDSTKMIKELLTRFPAVVERRSLVVSEQDVTFVNSLVPPPSAGMESGVTTEDERDDPAGSLD